MVGQKMLLLLPVPPAQGVKCFWGLFPKREKKTKKKTQNK